MCKCTPRAFPMRQVAKGHWEINFFDEEIPGSSVKSTFTDKTVCKARIFSVISWECLHFYARLDILQPILFFLYVYSYFYEPFGSPMYVRACWCCSSRYQCTRGEYHNYEQLQYTPRELCRASAWIFLLTRSFWFGVSSWGIHHDCIPDQELFHRDCRHIPDYRSHPTPLLIQWRRRNQEVEKECHLDLGGNIRDADSILCMEYTRPQNYWYDYRSLSRLGILGQYFLSDCQSSPDARRVWISPDGRMGIFHPSIGRRWWREDQKIK